MHFIMLTAFALNVAWCGSNHVFYLFFFFFFTDAAFPESTQSEMAGERNTI